MNEFPFTEADLKAAAIAVSDSMLASLPKPVGRISEKDGRIARAGQTASARAFDCAASGDDCAGGSGKPWRMVGG